MRKKICYLGVLAAVLASCTAKEALAPETAEVAPVVKADSVLLDFGAYVNRGTTTKAGWEGQLDNTSLIDPVTNGFGVFAYYNNGELYNEMAKPDFMYNQHITRDGTNWTYSPLRYWPNEFGSSAISEEVDRLTFFAYAPWVQVTPTTGVLIPGTGIDETTGIIGMSRNTATGDPLIKYAVNFTPGAGVDLCWGVVPAEGYTDVVTGATQSPSLTVGKTYQNVVKPTTDSKIKFDFKHALAALNVQIDTDIDAESENHGNGLENFTRIYVRSVSFEGFTTKGALDLNSDYVAGTNPKWLDLAGASKLSSDPITVYDGRRDGKEGIETGEAKNESPVNLNPKIIQSSKYINTGIDGDLKYTGFNAVQPGVSNVAVNLFDVSNIEDAFVDPENPTSEEVTKALSAPVYVIPTDGEEVKISIVYDVETADPTLAGYLSDGETHGVSVENAISNKITLAAGGSMKLVAGKKYTIKLHLGLTSVKFDATVSDWETGDNASTDLPHNTDSGSSTPSTNFVSGGTYTEPTILAADATTYEIVVSGFNVGDVVSVIRHLSPGNATDVVFTEGVSGGATTGDTVKIKITLAPNDESSSVESRVYLRRGASSPYEGMTIEVTQAGV